MHLVQRDGLQIYRECVSDMPLLWCLAQLGKLLMEASLYVLIWYEILEHWSILYWLLSFELTVIPTIDGKRSMMKLSQRMVSIFCASVSTSTAAQQYTTLAGSKDSPVRVTVRKDMDPSQPNGLVLCAATSIWLPVSPQIAFDFFRDVRMRPQVSLLNCKSLYQRKK